MEQIKKLPLRIICELCFLFGELGQGIDLPLSEPYLSCQATLKRLGRDTVLCRTITDNAFTSFWRVKQGVLWVMRKCLAQASGRLRTAFLQARDARKVDCCATLSYSLVFQKATEPLDCKLTDF